MARPPAPGSAGTSSPQAPLQIQRDSNIAVDWQSAQLRISGNTNANMQLNPGYDTTNNRGVIQAGQHNLGFKDLVLNPFGGNIGIGTTAPTERLEVVGNLKVSDDLRVHGSTLHVDAANERVTIGPL